MGCICFGKAKKELNSNTNGTPVSNKPKKEPVKSKKETSTNTKNAIEKENTEGKINKREANDYSHNNEVAVHNGKKDDKDSKSMDLSGMY